MPLIADGAQDAPLGGGGGSSRGGAGGRGGAIIMEEEEEERADDEQTCPVCTQHDTADAIVDKYCQADFGKQ